MTDPILKLADEQLRELSIDLMLQLEQGAGTRPVLYLLAQARTRAAKAVVMFIDADPADEKLIRRLQMELSVYDDMMRSAQQIFAEGKEANHRIGEADRQAIDELITEMPEETRRLHGFEPRGED